MFQLRKNIILRRLYFSIASYYNLELGKVNLHISFEIVRHRRKNHQSSEKWFSASSFGSRLFGEGIIGIILTAICSELRYKNVNFLFFGWGEIESVFI